MGGLFGRKQSLLEVLVARACEKGLAMSGIVAADAFEAGDVTGAGCTHINLDGFSIPEAHVPFGEEPVGEEREENELGER